MTYWLWIIDKYKINKQDYYLYGKKWMIKGSDRVARRFSMKTFQAICNRWYGKR
jgi:hypothetical protein